MEIAKTVTRKDILIDAAENAQRRKDSRHAATAKSRRKLYDSKFRDRLDRLIELAGGKCMDCGVSYPPWVYDFHHRDPSTKSFQLNMTHMGKLWDTLVTELVKCDLICANCHRTRHHDDKSKD